ncbi:transcription factor Opi1-domain-containing protein [Trametes punicea]|nr:transcription factor Opi1-domain-containing protein [Trametes punicea]
MALADEDESVRIAVRALGDMRNSTHASSPSTSFQPTPALSVTSGTSSPSLPSPSLVEEDRLEDRPTQSQSQGEAQAQGEGSEEWKSLSRVSNIPLVNSALRAYEHSKASSRVVKYGAEMMESSVKSISRPVIDRLPVGQLDDFACRQLDRLGSYTRRASSSSRSRNESPDPRKRWETRDVSMARADTDASQLPHEEDDMRGGSALSQSRTPTPNSSASSQPEKPTLPPASTLTQHADAQESQQVAQRSRWQAMILEAGGLSAAISEESMRRLRYCLQWLQYATTQIDAQILVLRNFIVSLQPDGNSPHRAPVSPQHLRTLQAAKRDVVDTIRQVVEVVSRYAGGALPEPARTRVRSFILCLPRRWAAASGATDGPSAAVAGHDVRGESTGTAVPPTSVRGRHRAAAPYSYGIGEPGPSPRSRPASRATSPVRGPGRGHGRQTSGSAGGAGAPPTADVATQSAQKILTLATESLDMLRSVTGVFKESLERADIWVERLRVVGLQRQQNPNGPDMVDPDNDSILNYRDAHLPPLRSHTHSPVTTPHSPYPPPLTPLTPGGNGTPSSGYGTPYFGLPRSSSTGSVSSLNLNTPAFPGPLNLSHPYTAGVYGNPDRNAVPPPYDAPSPAGVVGASFDKLSLTSASSSRFATPKSVLVGLPPEGDSGGGGSGGGGSGGNSSASTDASVRARGEKRRSESEADENDPAVVAATALAGLAGSGPPNLVSTKRVKQEEHEVGMDVDA